MHVVKPGLITAADGALFRQLFGMRHEGDYEDFVDYDCEDVKPFFPIAEQFLEKIRSLIEKS